MLEKMRRLSSINEEQVKAYNDFLGEIWKTGQGHDDLAEHTMKILLESPELSQKLLSVFFYLNP
jgi:hypothetical protein